MWGVLAWGLIIYFVASVIGSSFEMLTGVREATVYESSCVGGKTEDINKCTEENGRIYVRKRRFKVDFDHQRVVEAGSYNALEGCLVFDKDNWHCSSKDNTYYATMRDASYSNSYYYDIKTHTMYHLDVAVTVYWYYYWKRFFG